MYIYHVLLDTPSAHMTHINLNTIFYTHVEYSPIKTIYIKYYTLYGDKKQHNCNQFKQYSHTHTHTLTVAETVY